MYILLYTYKTLEKAVMHDHIEVMGDVFKCLYCSAVWRNSWKVFNERIFSVMVIRLMYEQLTSRFQGNHIINK